MLILVYVVAAYLLVCALYWLFRLENHLPLKVTNLTIPGELVIVLIISAVDAVEKLRYLITGRTPPPTGRPL